MRRRRPAAALLCAPRATLLAVSAGAAWLAVPGSSPALAVPSFARQTGQPCATCHTLEADWVPFGKQDSWPSPYLNLKLGAQFTHDFRFNGSSSDTDGFGRDAGDDDTVFLFAWLPF